MSEQKRALQSFVAGRHSSYITQFFRPHAVSSFSSRSEMKKALSLKSLERRLVLPMVERHWQRALEVLSAGYARAARTPEHYQRVIRMMVETEHLNFTHVNSTPHHNSDSYPSSMPHTDNNRDSPESHHSMRSSSSFLVAPLDSLLDKAYAGDIPSNASLFVTFIWAYCSIGAPFRAVDTFFMCLRRTGMSTASKEHVVGLLLPALNAKGVASSGGHSFREELSPLFSSSILHSETSLLDIMLEVLKVAGVPPPRYRCFLAEAAGLDGNWREALRWAPSNPLQLQEDLKTARMHWSTGEEKEWVGDVVKEYQMKGEKGEIEVKKWKKRNAEENVFSPVSGMKRNHLSSTFPRHYLSPLSSFRFTTPSGGAPASSLKDPTDKSVEDAVLSSRCWPILALATLLSPSALENVLLSVLEDAAGDGEKEEMVAQCTSLWTCKDEGAGSCLSSSPLTSASALMVARVLWNAVFPHRVSFSLSPELLCAMMNVLGVVSATMTSSATTTLRTPPRPTRSPTATNDSNSFYGCVEDLWKEVVYWFVHFFLCPHHVLLRLMDNTMNSKEREPHHEKDGRSPLPSPPPSALPFPPMHMQRYIPSSSSAEFGTFPFCDEYGSRVESKEGKREEDSTLISSFSPFAFTTTFPSHASLPHHCSSSSQPLSLTTSSLSQADRGLPFFFFHFPSSSQLPRHLLREVDSTAFPFLSSPTAFSPPSFPLSTVALHMVFAVYPMAEPCTYPGSSSHHPTAFTPSAMKKCDSSPPPPSVAMRRTISDEMKGEGKVEGNKSGGNQKWTSAEKHKEEEGEKIIHKDGQEGATVAPLPLDLSTSTQLDNGWPRNASPSFPSLTDNGDATATNTLHSFHNSGDCHSILTTSAMTHILPFYVHPLPFPTAMHPREIVSLFDDLLLHEGNMKITPFIISRVAPALLQLGEAKRATRLLEEVIRKEFQQEREESESYRFSTTSPSRGGRKISGEGVDNVDSVAKRQLQRTLLEMLSTAREYAGPHQCLNSREVQGEYLLRRNTNSTDKILRSSPSIFPKVSRDAPSKKDTHYFLSSSTPPPRAPVMAREREERHDAMQKEQFLQKQYNLQGRRFSLSSSPFNSRHKMLTHRPPSWYPDKSAEKDPLPPPIGLHDKASGWNYAGRGGEKAFFNSRRTPHTFSSWPKVMRSLADPYRGWNPRVNSSFGHRENVKKWNGRSSV